jgi:hypothetical protein
VEALHGGCGDPEGVGQHEGQEEVGVDLVSQAPNFPSQAINLMHLNLS